MAGWPDGGLDGWMAGWPTVIIMLLSQAGAWAWAELGNINIFGFYFKYQNRIHQVVKHLA